MYLWVYLQSTSVAFIMLRRSNIPKTNPTIWVTNRMIFRTLKNMKSLNPGIEPNKLVTTGSFGALIVLRDDGEVWSMRKAIPYTIKRKHQIM